jgi:hypothetical protein
MTRPSQIDGMRRFLTDTHESNKGAQLHFHGYHSTSPGFDVLGLRGFLILDEGKVKV